MAEKQKPQEDIVKLAGRAMTHPEQLTGSDIKRMAARILDDQKNDPASNKAKPSLASQMMAKVGDMIPDALKSKEEPKKASKPSAGPAPKPVAKPKAPRKAKTPSKA